MCELRSALAQESDGAGKLRRGGHGPAPSRRTINAANRLALALRLWNEARDPRGTMVADYLASRGLSLPTTLPAT